MVTLECIQCLEFLGESKFPYANKLNPFFKAREGRSSICFECLKKEVNVDDCNSVEKLCQWLDVPFEPNIWLHYLEENRDNALALYLHQDWGEQTHECIDWSSLNKVFFELQRSAQLEEEIELLKDKKFKELRHKWPGEWKDEELEYLEDYYLGVLNSQSFSNTISKDLIRKLAMTSLTADKKLRAGIDAKDEISTHNALLKAAGIEIKTSKDESDFESIGELVYFLQSKGSRYDYNQGPKDDIDFAIREIQESNARLIKSESGLYDQVQSRINSYNLHSKMEEEQRNSEKGENLFDFIQTTTKELDEIYDNDEQEYIEETLDFSMLDGDDE